MAWISLRGESNVLRFISQFHRRTILCTYIDWMAYRIEAAINVRLYISTAVLSLTVSPIAFQVPQFQSFILKHCCVGKKKREDETDMEKALPISTYTLYREQLSCRHNDIGSALSRAIRYILKIRHFFPLPRSRRL